MSRRRAKRPVAAAAAAQRAPGSGARPAAPRLRLGRREALALLAVVAAACLVTANGLGGELVLDDTSKIVRNTDIRRLNDLPSRLVYPYESNQLLERNDPSRPLVFLIYGVTYHFFGLNPVAYHAVNAFVHAAAGILVFLLTRLLLWRLLGEARTVAPLLVALFFVVTPIQVGTVIYAYALNDVLASALMLASIYAFVRRPEPRPADVAASVLALALALAAKQSAVVVPALVLVFDVFACGRATRAALVPRLRLYVPHLALIAAFLAWRFWYFGALGDIEGRGSAHPALEYFLVQPAVILKYLFSSVVPYQLAIDHYLVPRNVDAGARALGFGILLMAGAALAWLWRARTPIGRYVLFAAAFYVVVLAPTSSVLPTVDVMVERRVYLANLAVFLLFVLGWDRLAGVGLFAPAASRVGVALACAHLVTLAGVSIHRNQVYATNEGVWQDVLRIYPASERAINNLGNVYLERKEYHKAKACFEQLVGRNPRDYIAQQNLGSIHERADSPYHDVEKAIGYFKAAIAANAGFAEAHYNLGRLYQKLAQARRDDALMADAVACYRRALQLNPSHVLAHNNLGLIYFHQGRREEARQEYETALRLDPNCEPAKTNLKLLDAPPSGPADARSVPLDQVPRETLIRLYEEALNRDPNNATIRQKYDELRRNAPPK